MKSRIERKGDQSLMQNRTTGRIDRQGQQIDRENRAKGKKSDRANRVTEIRAKVRLQNDKVSYGRIE